VTLRVDTIEMSDDGPNRVRISGVNGEPPPPTLKVSLNGIGGFRNEMSIGLITIAADESRPQCRR
jgi:hypothetical protein